MPNCKKCGDEGFVYSTHYADPHSTTRRCECQDDPDPDAKFEREREEQ